MTILGYLIFHGYMKYVQIQLNIEGVIIKQAIRYKKTSSQHDCIELSIQHGRLFKEGEATVSPEEPYIQWQ